MTRHAMNCGALILAAGASTRLGHPKQLVRLDGETLLDRVIRVASEAGCAPVVVILGAFEAQIRDQCKLEGVEIISHHGWAQGMGTTISVGVRAFGDISGILILTCDMPAVDADHLQSLANPGILAASCYGGRNGVPAYFPRASFADLLKLRGDVGAREILQTARGVSLSGGELDIDTSEDLAEARVIFNSIETAQ